MSSDGVGARVSDEPRVGFYLTEYEYAPDEQRPRFLKDRLYLTCSIWAEDQPDDTTIMMAEIDGRPADPFVLWNKRLWPVSEAEYLDRRRNHV